MEGHGAVETLLTRVRDWWRRQNELSGLDDKELGRVAAELGMSTNALEDLVERGPDAAHNLYERMRALGLSKADVDTAAQGVMRDLQRTCACCNEKGIMASDAGTAAGHVRLVGYRIVGMWHWPALRQISVRPRRLL